MIVKNLTDPFPHTMFYDFYDKAVLQSIWQELDFLNQPDKLMNNSIIGDTPAPEHKSGLYLDDVYPHRPMSNILMANRKLFDVADDVDNYFLRNQLKAANCDFTWLCYYYSGTYYGSHPDRCMLSAVTTFWREPKAFTGGDLTFTNYGYVPDMQTNTVILFPSFEPHEVTEITVAHEDTVKGLSRWSMNQFLQMYTKAVPERPQ